MKEYTKAYNALICVGDILEIKFGDYVGKAKVESIEDNDRLNLVGIGRLECSSGSIDIGKEK
jgi:hypothetical protein